MLVLKQKLDFHVRDVKHWYEWSSKCHMAGLEFEELSDEIQKELIEEFENYNKEYQQAVDS